MRKTERILALVALILACPVAAAQSWPAKPVRIIVAFPPGGVTDVTTRIVAQRLTAALGQQVLVENRPGAGSMIGTEFVARAAPDGYTFLSTGTSSLAINPHLNPNITYNPLRDFAPVTQLATSDVVMCVHPSVQAKTAEQLVRLAARRPNELNYGSAGIGSTYHLAMALFAALTNSKLVHIPNRGSAEALNDLIAGQTHVQADSVTLFKPHIASGKIHPIGVMAARRSPLLPDVPTMGEQGIKGLDLSSWVGLVAPSATPEAILERMNAESVKVLAIPEVRERMNELGMVPVGSSRKDFGSYMAAAYATWGDAVRISGAKVE